MEPQQDSGHESPTNSKKNTAAGSGGNVSRRTFLRGGGCALGAAGIMTIPLTHHASAASTAAERREAGYRETEHVRRVYELSRF